MKLITGDWGSGKTTRVAEAIADAVRAGTPCFLIVPEQQTVTCEDLLAGWLPPSAPLCFEVTNFTRLADTVFRKTGGIAARIADAEVEQLTMWRTLTAVSGGLRRPPKRVEVGVVSSLRRAVRELRAMCLTPDKLIALSGVVDDRGLSDKLYDLGVLSDAFHQDLTRVWGDASDRLDLLADVLRKQKPLAGCTVFVDGFSSFTEQEYAVLEVLAETCPLTVTLTVPPRGTHPLSAHETADTRRRLLRLAARVGQDVCVEHLGETKRHLPGAVRYVAERLFLPDYTACPPYPGGAEDGFRLVEAPDPTEMTDFVAADILRRVQEEGAHFSDFTVVCASGEPYRGVLDAAFDKNGIPCFFARETDLLTLPPVKMILTAYAVVTGGWRREDLIGYLKCGFSGVTPDAVDRFEAYCETWDLHGKRFTDGEAWCMSPRGLAGRRGEATAYDDRLLSDVNRVKADALPPLIALGEDVRAEQPVREQIRTLTEFLLKTDYPAALNRMADRLGERGETARADEYRRLWDVLCDALDTLNATLADTVLSAADFAALLRLLFGSAKIGRIPASQDEVTVGEAALLRAQESRHVYLIGVNEGEFPEQVADDGTFTEAERALLTACGVETSDSLDTRLSRALSSFLRALTLSSGTVTVLWSLTKPDFEPANPSDALIRIRHLLGADYPVLRLGRDNTLNRLYTPAAAAERIGRLSGTACGRAVEQVLGEMPAYTRLAGEAHRPVSNTDLSLSPAVSRTVFPETLNLTQSRIERFVGCPLGHYLQYVLRLDADETAEFDPANIGTLLHRLLELYFSTVREQGLDFRTMTEAEQTALIDRLAERAMREKLPPDMAGAPRTAALMANLKQRFLLLICDLAEEFRNSRFTPAFFELPIRQGNTDAPAPITFSTPDGKRIAVYGVIDRVDTYRAGEDVYVRVVDYKTGSKDFRPDDLKTGSNLQLFLYLFSIWKTDSAAFRKRLGVGDGGAILPAGVLYLSSLNADAATVDAPSQLRGAEASVPAPGAPDGGAGCAPEAPQTGAGCTPFVRNGILLNDFAVLKAMDSTPDMHFLPVTPTKSEEIDKRGQAKLRDLRGFETLMEETGNTLLRIGDAMRSGTLTAAPLSGGDTGACDYCPYRAVCRRTER